jgi:hypothetical protein
MGECMGAWVLEVMFRCSCPYKGNGQEYVVQCTDACRVMLFGDRLSCTVRAGDVPQQRRKGRYSVETPGDSLLFLRISTLDPALLLPPATRLLHVVC